MTVRKKTPPFTNFKLLIIVTWMASFHSSLGEEPASAEALAFWKEKANQLRPMIGVVKVTLMKRLDVIQPVGLF